MSRAVSPSSDEGSESTSPGAAQFLANLSPEQLQHLQFSVPQKEEPERFSAFLEEPRKVPVPKRFTFDLIVLAELARKNERVYDGKTPGKQSVNSGGTRSGSAASSRMSVDMLKEATVVKIEKVASVDWRSYFTGVCLCVLNLVVAWDASMLSIALSVSCTLRL